MSSNSRIPIDWREATQSVLEFCGVRARPRISPAMNLFDRSSLPGREINLDSAPLFDETGKSLGVLAPSINRVRRIPEDREPSEPELPKPTHPLHLEHGVSARLLAEVPESWRPILFTLFEGVRHPVAWRSDGTMIFSIAIRDALAAELAFPPLEHGYFDRLNQASPEGIANWLGGKLTELPDAGFKRIEAPRPTLTLRLDYDRAIPSEELNDLLDLLEQTGVRTSCGFLLRREDDVTAARRMHDAGHEILLHTEARGRDGFLAECELFERRFQVRPQGYTAHGGRGSAGYLGQRQWSWAIEAGMTYGEMMVDREIRKMHRVVLVGDDAVAHSASLLAPGVHFSLDLGMKPKAHALKHLVEVVPPVLASGGHAVVMNHPDLHRRELESLLEHLMESRPRTETFTTLATEYERTHGL